LTRNSQKGGAATARPATTSNSKYLKSPIDHRLTSGDPKSAPPVKDSDNDDDDDDEDIYTYETPSDKNLFKETGSEELAAAAAFADNTGENNFLSQLAATSNIREKFEVQSKDSADWDTDLEDSKSINLFERSTSFNVSKISIEQNFKSFWKSFIHTRLLLGHKFARNRPNLRKFAQNRTISHEFVIRIQEN
jgi:hypothetical protein